MNLDQIFDRMTPVMQTTVSAGVLLLIGFGIAAGLLAMLTYRDRKTH